MSATVKALQIIKQYKIGSPSAFARKMWPDSLGWKRMGRCGANGSTAGIGMNLAGGGFLGKLRARGLVTGLDPVRLTPAGELMLKEATE